jgi:hypothetical protein
VPRVVEFVRIVNPKQPGESLVLAKDDFDPAVHTLFVETPAQPEPEPEPELTATPAQELVAPPAPAKPKRERKPKPASMTETV